MKLRLPVDHLVCVVNDLSRAVTSFVDADFTATPISRHSDAMGTANSCILLDGAYIELMGIVAGTPANEGWRALLAQGHGLKGIALASDDIAATEKALELQGIAGEVRHFSRAVPEGELRFSVIRLPREMTPGLQCLYCQHHTPALLWTLDAMRHANGATRILSASAPGVEALSPLAVSTDGLPMADTPQAAIVIGTAEPVSAERRDAILAATGIAIETRPGK
ncbi:VOC family protein [Mesorhizobium microcysteis]|uniref:VOC family protein n=1 Tax=Neoaquamicrobium microcysteis TaxID=2682781 RepID=A0A5D4GYG9_9HYPH|nr:VOC family protein [Mesorhizobium microcysteis]TYR31570.1 VOC family protein [Mesorhizobium microcysteis]